jgi:hypothetical protein
MPILDFIIAASAILTGAATIYGAYARDWKCVFAGALSFGVILIPLAYDKLAMKVILKGGPVVTVGASRGEK